MISVLIFLLLRLCVTFLNFLKLSKKMQSLRPNSPESIARLKHILEQFPSPSSGKLTSFPRRLMASSVSVENFLRSSNDLWMRVTVAAVLRGLIPYDLGDLMDAVPFVTTSDDGREGRPSTVRQWGKGGKMCDSVYPSLLTQKRAESERGRACQSRKLKRRM